MKVKKKMQWPATFVPTRSGAQLLRTVTFENVFAPRIIRSPYSCACGRICLPARRGTPTNPCRAIARSRRGSAVRLRRKEARLASRTRALRSDSDRRGQLVRPPLSRTPRSQWRDLRHGKDDGSSSYATVRNLVARHQCFQWQNSGSPGH